MPPMSVQEVFDGARATSIANKAGIGPLTTREILERANFAQQELHTRLAQENRYFYAVKATPNSTAGGPGSLSATKQWALALVSFKRF